MDYRLNNNEPILIMGMHRSGTGLVSQILKDNGVFIGSFNQKDKESIFFLNINRWIMSQYSSSWKNPRNINNDNKSIDISSEVRNILCSRYSALFFGYSYFLQKQNFLTINNNWGFKDPRNIFTYPIWKNIYPNLKSIIIVRHPIDVVNSLLVRSENNHQYELVNLLKYFLPFDYKVLKDDYKISSLEEAIDLYKIYYDAIIDIKSKNQDALIIKYEDLLLDSQNTISIMFKYLNLPYNKKLIRNVLAMFDPSRAFAYRQMNDKYTSDTLNNLIVELGYNDV